MTDNKHSRNDRKSRNYSTNNHHSKGGHRHNTHNNQYNPNGNHPESYILYLNGVRMGDFEIRSGVTKLVNEKTGEELTLEKIELKVISVKMTFSTKVGEMKCFHERGVRISHLQGKPYQDGFKLVNPKPNKPKTVEPKAEKVKVQTVEAGNIEAVEPKTKADNGKADNPKAEVESTDKKVKPQKDEAPKSEETAEAGKAK